MIPISLTPLGRLICLAVALYAIPTFAASFDCNKSRTWVEKTICDDPELSQLDNALAEQYQLERAGTEGYASVSRQQQLDWLTFQRNTCEDTLCLSREYNERLGIWSPVGGHWRVAFEVEPPSRALGTFSETRRISLYDPDAANNETVFMHTNSLSIKSHADDFTFADIDSSLIFDRGHTCEISGKASWWQNHWSLKQLEGEQVVELRLYPAIHQGIAQILIKDIDQKYREFSCGMRGYLDGLKLDKQS